jgi:hypothetical protein
MLDVQVEPVGKDTVQVTMHCFCDKDVVVVQSLEVSIDQYKYSRMTTRVCRNCGTEYVLHPSAGCVHVSSDLSYLLKIAREAVDGGLRLLRI